MRILVNRKNIDFTLENEKKLGDIIRDLEKWITQNDNVIRSVKINNKDFDLENFNNDNSMKIEDVNKVEILTSNKIELAFDTLRTINDYSISILNVFDSSIDEIIKNNDEIMEGLALILEGIRLSLKILNINPAVIITSKEEKLEIVLMELTRIKNEYERKYLDNNAVDDLKNLLNNMKEYVIKIYKWGVVKNYRKVKNETFKVVPFIDEILKDLLLVCRDAEKKFEEIGTSIQIGDDLKAFNGIYYLSGILNEVIEVFKVIKGSIFKNGKDILEILETERIFGDITNDLRRIEESFHNEDLVNLADVMEYELKPQFGKLVDIINKINDFIKII